MKTFVTLALAVIFIASSTWGEVRKPSVSKSPMDPDQLAVYRLFLRKYEKGNTARLNLSDLTSTFSPMMLGACKASNSTPSEATVL